MTSAFQSIRGSLNDIAGSSPTSAPAPGAPTGRLKFEPDEIGAIVKDWVELATGYNKSIIDARRLTSITGPGEEYVSYSHARMASESGAAYLASLEQKLEYSIKQGQKFQDALNAYTGTEGENVDKLVRGGPSLPGGI